MSTATMTTWAGKCDGPPSSVWRRWSPLDGTSSSPSTPPSARLCLPGSRSARRTCVRTFFLLSLRCWGKRGPDRATMASSVQTQGQAGRKSRQLVCWRSRYAMSNMKCCVDKCFVNQVMFVPQLLLSSWGSWRCFASHFIHLTQCRAASLGRWNVLKSKIMKKNLNISSSWKYLVIIFITKFLLKRMNSHSQQQGPGFDSRPGRGAFLCGICRICVTKLIVCSGWWKMQLLCWL